MNKEVKFVFGGLNQDESKSKHPLQYYYDAKNIRIVNTTEQSNKSITNEKGNEFILELPNITINSSDNSINYNDTKIIFTNTSDNELLHSTLPLTSNSQKIIGHTVTRDTIILLTTDDNGFDCIWEITEVFTNKFELNLLYCRNLNFSSSNPIQVVFNYENENIQKIYWVDGINQLRFLNIKHSKVNGDLENLIDLNSNSINIVSNYSLSQPLLKSKSGGGLHTSGMVQYAYNLYKLNGSQTTISPVSDLISLDKGLSLGGGEINEIVGTTPFLNISKIDDNYTHIKIYAIKYTSYNENPSISLIKDEEIDSFINYKFNDDGSKINDISLSEFIFLGSNPITPNHIESKDNRLFAANYKESAYTLDIDMRAYSHNSLGGCKLYTGNIEYINGNLNGLNQTFNSSTPISNYNYNIKYDAINPDYDVYKYQKNGNTLGGEGNFITYELTQKTLQQLGNISLKDIKFLKDNEIYRIGIQFYNKLGQKTDVIWIADFKTPEGNLEGKYNTLKTTLKSTEINNYINSLNLSDNDKPVGYKILRAERNIKDMTILCQGSLTGMMVQTTQDVKNYQRWGDYNNRKNQSKKEVKLPIPLTRGFSLPSTEKSLLPTTDLQQMNNSPNGFREKDCEIYTDADTSYKRQQTWQYTKMMQMHSPDVLFNTGLSFSNGLELKVKGAIKHDKTNQWYKRIDIKTKSAVNDDIYIDIDNLKSKRKPGSFGTFGPVYDGCKDSRTDFLTYNRQYTTYHNIMNGVSKPIYGIPEVSDKGQGVTSYNGDSEFNYTNSLESLITDKYKGSSQDDEAIEGINSWGSKSLTIVLGNDSLSESNRPALESLVPSDIKSSNALVLTEIVRPKSYIYGGSLYGGVSIEDKSRTSYIEIGSYNDITTIENEIDNCGDTFVQLFKFGRILKTDTELYDCRKMQLSEIVEHPVETTINLMNRDDVSVLGWNNKFQPRYDEFHKYNRVYSQNSNLIKNQSDSFKFKKVKRFDTRVISSKIKASGEFIDSWTDFLENETLDLDGKYGSINGLVNSKDIIYALQDTAVSKLSINPRVQTQGADGIGIELGTGGILNDYHYISTSSGTLNKWSIFTSANGFYYFDLINKSYNKIDSQGMNPITSTKGLHSYFQNNLDYDKLLKDNPYLRSGVIGIYDNVNKEALLTLLQGDKSFTLGFNEKLNVFTSFYDYLPSTYITKGYKMISCNSDNNKLYNHFEGEYGKFYDIKYPSYITLMINPESDIDCIFDNIEYNSEIYLNDIDQSDKTLTHIQAYNEYQDSGKVPLIIGRQSNLRRFFRKWRANIPREGRVRMRNPWIFLKLELDNESNYKLILHDIIVKYTV